MAWTGGQLVSKESAKARKGKHTVDHAGSRHGHCKASVHAPIKEANRRALRVVFVAHEAVALIARLRRIDGKDLASLVSPGTMHHCAEKFRHTQAQETSPQAPPAKTTASGLAGFSPLALASICFTLSYVMKYTPVPMVSRSRW